MYIILEKYSGTLLHMSSNRTGCKLNTLNNYTFNNWIYTEASRRKVSIHFWIYMYMVGVTCQQDKLRYNVNN